MVVGRSEGEGGRGRGKRGPSKRGKKVWSKLSKKSSLSASLCVLAKEEKMLSN